MTDQKPIKLSQHARQQMEFRGANENEIIETIRTESWSQAKSNKLECRKDFLFQAEWNGKYYETKQVRPVFVEEQEDIVVVTVYVYFF